MNSKTAAIKKHLKKLSSKQIAEHSQRFFKTGEGEYGEGDIFLGIRIPQLRKLAGDYKHISIKEALSLLKSKFHEERLLSLFILIHLYRTSDDAAKKEIYNAYLSNTRFINNWDLVDSSAAQIIGAHLWKSDRKILYKLAASKSLWERRISIISTFYFIRRNDFKDALNISEILLSDTEDLIHKASGWMLREAGKRDLKTEESFLNKYCTVMPRTMLRYAIEKLPERKRKEYLKKGGR